MPARKKQKPHKTASSHDSKRLTQKDRTMKRSALYAINNFEHHFRALPVVLLFIIATMLIPHKSVRAIGTPAMAFPSATSDTASVVYHNAATDNYTPASWSTHIITTSYNSVPWQTDSTPFITASGTRTRDGVVASNYLPIGTKVRFPDLYGSKVFIVEDRMNSRYFKRIDIWSDDLDFSRNFGARYLRMDILKVQ